MGNFLHNESLLVVIGPFGRKEDIEGQKLATLAWTDDKLQVLVETFGFESTPIIDGLVPVSISACKTRLDLAQLHLCR